MSKIFLSLLATLLIQQAHAADIAISCNNSETNDTSYLDLKVDNQSNVTEIRLPEELSPQAKAVVITAGKAKQKISGKFKNVVAAQAYQISAETESRKYELSLQVQSTGLRKILKISIKANSQEIFRSRDCFVQEEMSGSLN